MESVRPQVYRSHHIVPVAHFDFATPVYMVAEHWFSQPDHPVGDHHASLQLAALEVDTCPCAVETPPSQPRLL